MPKRIKIETNLALEFSDPKNQKDTVKLLMEVKGWLLTPSHPRSNIRTLIQKIEDQLETLTRKDKYVSVAHEYVFEWNQALYYSELLIKTEAGHWISTGINNIGIKTAYYQEMIDLFLKYRKKDEGSCISGAGLVNSMTGQVICGQIAQGSITNEQYLKEAQALVAKHTDYKTEILPGMMV